MHNFVAKHDKYKLKIVQSGLLFIDPAVYLTRRRQCHISNISTDIQQKPKVGTSNGTRGYLMQKTNTQKSRDTVTLSSLYLYL